MAFPIVPIALAAGAVALARNISISPVDQRVEDRLDEVAEGLAAHRDTSSEQVNASYGYRRIVRFGRNGPGLEIDARVLGRLKVSRIN